MSFAFSTEELSKNPIDYAEKVPVDILASFIEECNDKYENGVPILSDHIYDQMFAVFKKNNPEHILLKKIGAEPNSNHDKVRLPIHMGSMDKKLTKKSIDTWLQKYRGPEYIVSSKLDGASGLLVKTKGVLHLYSRGNGTIGRNLDHLIPFLKVPEIPKDFVIRGELIVSKKDKSEKFTNARSMINGIMGRKTVNEDTKCIKFVTYNLLSYDQKKIVFSLSDQLKILGKLGFHVVKHSKIRDIYIPDKIEDSQLSKMLMEYRLESEYDIDGIIITDNNRHKPNKLGNPDYAFAFKSNGLGKITNVKRVDWNVSKHGYLIPRLEIDPINIEGTNIKYATAFNAKYVLSNKIGSGTKVRVIRSGDVIPYVIEIIESTEAQMPEIEYQWTDSGVNAIATDDSMELNLKKMTAFTQTLGMPFLSSGIIKKLYENDIRNIRDLISISKEKLLSMDGIQHKMANKLYESINSAIDKPQPLEKIMTASLCFGHGFAQKKLKSIIEFYPDVLTNQNIDIDGMTAIPGVSRITAKAFLDRRQQFNEWLKLYPEIIIQKNNKSKSTVGSKYQNKTFVFTGFRNKDLEQKIESNGGKIGSQINKKTSFLVVKSLGTSSSKVSAAELLGIPIITPEQII